MHPLSISLGARVADGHAWLVKHKAEFSALGILEPDVFAAHIAALVDSSETLCIRGRQASFFYNQATDTAVIEPHMYQQGEPTAFRQVGRNWLHGKIAEAARDDGMTIEILHGMAELHPNAGLPSHIVPTAAFLRTLEKYVPAKELRNALYAIGDEFPKATSPGYNISPMDAASFAQLNHMLYQVEWEDMNGREFSFFFAKEDTAPDHVSRIVMLGATNELDAYGAQGLEDRTDAVQSWFTHQRTLQTGGIQAKAWDTATPDAQENLVTAGISTRPFSINDLEAWQRTLTAKTYSNPITVIDSTLPPSKNIRNAAEVAKTGRQHAKDTLTIWNILPPSRTPVLSQAGNRAPNSKYPNRPDGSGKAKNQR